jgi:uncharacterized protein
MRLSEDKISHIAHLLIEGPEKAGLIRVEEKLKLLNQTKEVLTTYCKLDDEIDAIVRKKLATYSRSIGEGSREWDVMYKKHFDEEMKKKWR